MSCRSIRAMSGSTVSDASVGANTGEADGEARCEEGREAREEGRANSVSISGDARPQLNVAPPRGESSAGADSVASTTRLALSLVVGSAAQ